ncbi:MAG: hypothetical protein JXX14_02160 [Deltaproteobacteria bacterium]|nr:hypothetical protein [Deltaproteobacteria bacterium]
MRNRTLTRLFSAGFLSAALVWCFAPGLFAAEDKGASAIAADVQTDSNSFDTVSILLVSTGDNGPTVPTVNDVTKILAPELEKIGVQIRLDALEKPPLDQDAWATYSLDKSLEIPGILAVFNWQCAEDRGCRVFVMETHSLALSSIPVGEERAPIVRDGNMPDSDDINAENIAAGIKEAVYGELLFALPQVSRHANDPSLKTASTIRAQSKSSEVDAPLVVVEKFVPPVYDRTAHRLWLEFGYIGNYPYPASRTQHGVMLGMTVFLHKHFAPALRVGGLARRHDKGQMGDMVAYQVPVSLLLQFPMYIGATVISIAPVVQYDYNWARSDTVLNETLNQYYSDFSFGGETTFRVPMPKKSIEIFYGAGILATLFSEPYITYHEKIIPATQLQFYWYAGFSKNLFAN